MAPSSSDAERRDRIERIVRDVQARRARGESVSDTELIACHPELAPDLASALFPPADATVAIPLDRPAVRASDAVAERAAASSGMEQTLIVPPGGDAASRGTSPSEEGGVVVRKSAHEARSETSKVPPEIRTMIPGYDIAREISRGGQGVVYLAMQQATKRRVAVKLLLSGVGASPTVRRRFEREIELVAQLRHPNIISIFHSGTTRDGRQFYVMDYVDGVTLDRYVRDRQCTLEETLHLFLAVCDGVQYAHQRGMIHRDLKPGNVLVTEEDLPDLPAEGSGERLRSGPSRSDGSGTAPRALPKILDFGLAKLLDQSAEAPVSLTDEVVGTLPYMSPEQATGRHELVDTRTDVYALGVILYNLLTGDYPYRVVGSLMEVVRNITDTSPMPPIRKWHSSDNGLRRKLSKVCPFDEDVQTIVLKALAKEPDRRYQSAGEFARDLRRYLAGEPIEARADSSWYVLRKTVKRYRTGLAVFAAFVLMVCGTAAWMYVLYQEQSRLRKEAQDQKEQADAAKDAALAAKAAADQAREAEADARKLADAQRLEAERQAYLAGIGGADAALRAGDVAAANLRLDQTAEPLRGWEWHYLRESTDRSTFTFDGVAPVLDVAFSSDGSRIAWAAEDRVIHMASLESRQIERIFEGHKDAVSGVRFSVDDRIMASGGMDGELLLWDVSSGSRAASLPGHTGGVTRLAFHPGGSMLASASRDRTVRLWSMPDGSPFATLDGHEGWVTALEFSSNGRRLLSGAWDNTVRVWDVASRKEVLKYSGHPQKVNALAVSRYSDMVASASWGMIKVWSASTGQEITTLQIAGGDVTRVAISPDGTRVATGSSDGGLRLYDATTRFEIAVLRGHLDRITAVSFSPDFSWIATASVDGTVRLWDANHAEKGSLPVSVGGGVTAAAVTADGRTLAVAPTLNSADNVARVALYDLVSGRRLGQFDAHGAFIESMSFSPDGRRFVTCSADRTLKVWEMSSLVPLDGAVEEGASGPPPIPVEGLPASRGQTGAGGSFDAGSAPLFSAVLAGAPMRVAWSGKGSFIVVGLAGGETVLFPVSAPDERIMLTGHSDAVVAAGFSPDESALATGSWDGTVRLWSLPEGRLIAEQRRSKIKITSVVFVGKARVAFGGDDGRVTLWTPATNQTISTAAVGHGAVVELSPNVEGERLAAGMSSGQVVLLEAASLTPLLTLRGHENDLIELSWTYNGSGILSASTDGVVRLWNAR